MEFITSQDTSSNGICQSFFIFLVCILLPSGALSLLSTALMLLTNTVALVNEREQFFCWEARNYSVHALTFDLHTYAYNFLLLSVVWCSFQNRVWCLMFISGTVFWSPDVADVALFVLYCVSLFRLLYGKCQGLSHSMLWPRPSCMCLSRAAVFLHILFWLVWESIIELSVLTR